MAWMTRAQMRADAFRQFGEAAGFVTNDDVNSWLNEGYEVFASKSECLIAYRILGVVEGKVIVPGDFVQLLSIDTGSQYKIHEYEVGTNVIVLRPSTIAVDRVNVRYVAVPSADESSSFSLMMDDASKTALNPHGDRAVIKFALSRMYTKDTRTQESNNAMAEFANIAHEELVRTSPQRRKMPVRTDAWTGAVLRAGAVLSDQNSSRG